MWHARFVTWWNWIETIPTEIFIYRHSVIPLHPNMYRPLFVRSFPNWGCLRLSNPYFQHWHLWREFWFHLGVSIRISGFSSFVCDFLVNFSVYCFRWLALIPIVFNKSSIEFLTVTSFSRDIALKNKIFCLLFDEFVINNMNRVWKRRRQP